MRFFAASAFSPSTRIRLHGGRASELRTLENAADGRSSVRHGEHRASAFNGDASGNLRVDGGEPVDRFRYAATSIDARPRWRRYIAAAQSHAGCCRSLSRSRSAASGNGPGNGYGNSSGNRIGKSSAAAVKSATVKLAPTRYPDG